MVRKFSNVIRRHTKPPDDKRNKNSVFDTITAFLHFNIMCKITRKHLQLLILLWKPHPLLSSIRLEMERYGSLITYYRKTFLFDAFYTFTSLLFWPNNLTHTPKKNLKLSKKFLHCRLEWNNKKKIFHMHVSQCVVLDFVFCSTLNHPYKKMLYYIQSRFLCDKRIMSTHWSTKQTRLTSLKNAFDYLHLAHSCTTLTAAVWYGCTRCIYVDCMLHFFKYWLHNLEFYRLMIDAVSW